MNPDIFFAKDYISKMVKAFDKSDEIGMVQGKLLQVGEDEDFPQKSIIDSVGEKFPKNLRIRMDGYGKPDNGQFDIPKFIFGPSGPAPLYKKEMLEDIKINDECYDNDFFMYREEADLAWRAQIMGWKCFYNPKAVAYHVRAYSPKTRKTMSRKARQLQIRNRWLMIVKNVFFKDLFFILPHLLIFELCQFGYIFLREPHLIKSIKDFFKLLPKILSKRASIMKRRKVGAGYFLKLMRGS